MRTKTVLIVALVFMFSFAAAVLAADEPSRKAPATRDIDVPRIESLKKTPAAGDVKAASAEKEPPEKALTARDVVFVPIWGPITDKTAGQVAKQIKARSRTGKIVVLDIDTPGGYVTAAEEMAKIVAENSHMRFIAYISGKHYSGAWSAGAFMAFCCEKIYINPGKGIGAAMAIITGDGVTDRAKPKFESYWAAKMRAIAQRNGHSGALAEAMIVVETQLWKTGSEDDLRILTGLEYNALSEAAKKKAEQFKKKGTILSLTDKEAEGLGVVAILETDALAKTLGIPEEEERKFRSYWRSVRRKAEAVEKKRAVAKVKLEKGALTIEKLRIKADADFALAQQRPTRKRVAAVIKTLNKYAKCARAQVVLARKYPELQVSPERFELMAKQAAENVRVLKDIRKRMRR